MRINSAASDRAELRGPSPPNLDQTPALSRRPQPSLAAPGKTRRGINKREDIHSMTTVETDQVNGVDTHVLRKTVEAVSENPDMGRCEFRVCNNWVNGDLNRSSTRDFYAACSEQQHKETFHFQAGEPALMAGNDEGANPVEFLLSALSGCMTTTVAYYAALNGITIQKMESIYKGQLDLRGLFNLDKTVRPGYQKIQVHFKIETDAPKEELVDFFRFSPVYDVVSKSVPVEISVETY